MRCVEAYDRPCYSRRRKRAILFEGYGGRVQESGCECELAVGRFAQLQARLKQLIRPEQDALRLWPLSRRYCARIINLGTPVMTPSTNDVVV